MQQHAGQHVGQLLVVHEPEAEEVATDEGKRAVPW